MQKPKLDTRPPPSMLVRKYRKGNLMILTGLLSAVAGIYGYTMWTASRGSFTSEELNETVQKKKI